MIRLVNIFAIAVTVMFAFGLYTMKYKTSIAEDQVRLLAAQMGEEEDALRILRAEWAYLNRADFLERLAAEHLIVAPVHPDQIVELSDLPMRPVFADAPDLGMLVEQTSIIDRETDIVRGIRPMFKPTSFTQRRQ